MGAELFRMEQYVDMVLQYLRLDGGENDLVITRCDLDELIREAVRRYGPQFVLRKLSLHYEPTERTVVTDRKWFVCILEQLLSNAIKYTPEGCITIRLEGDCLRISDTGIGIAPEDLPRIFEKGYTGENGRLERTSSGLGLYLAGKAAALLHIPITVDSRPGQGTTFTHAPEAGGIKRKLAGLRRGKTREFGFFDTLPRPGLYSTGERKKGPRRGKPARLKREKRKKREKKW